MPLVVKLCILCGRWIKRKNRKKNSLCHRCIEKYNVEVVWRKQKEREQKEGNPWPNLNPNSE